MHSRPLGLRGLSLFAQNQMSFDGRRDDVFWIEVTAIWCEAGGGMLAR